MTYNLTENQKEVATWLVDQNQNHGLEEEFHVYWRRREAEIMDHPSTHPNLTKGTLNALQNDNLIYGVPNLESSSSEFAGKIKTSEIERSRLCTLLARIFEAVDSDFDEPDTSFLVHLSPLADVSNLDDELKTRCLPILGAGSADPKLWDSAVRTAGVILEERLRDVGGITDTERIGRQLVNDIFGDKGVLSSKFANDSERQGYRDLYSGITGTFRNPSAHGLMDPAPEDGGAFIVFVNVLMKMLDDLSVE